jgi:3'-phosphoadenosine 5'-phosphosulfate sulfotransferase (PAPS reductase)/FAD synthetase
VDAVQHPHCTGEHFRVFPISNWTELDVWQYIAREHIALPSIYYTHKRDVVERKGLLVPVTELTRRATARKSCSATCAFAPWATSPAPAPWKARQQRPKTS